MRGRRVMVGLEMPYPLDSESANAVEAAKQHAIMTWVVLEGSGEPDQWVLDSFLAEGKTALPEGAYKLRKPEGSTDPRATSPPSMEEVQAMFSEPESYERFISGEDYSFGLVDVPDTEFEGTSAALIQAIKDLGHQGVMVDLPTVPHAFLRDAPLVGGVWIDRYVVELAEWGASIIEQGYKIEETDDNHPFAWYRSFDSEDESEASQEVMAKLWRQTRKRLAGFKCGTKEIDGRRYLEFDVYLTWRGRRAKGNLKSALTVGLDLSRWNRWVEAEGGDHVATLASVKVARLDSYGDGYRIQVCDDTDKLAETISQRQRLLRSLTLKGAQDRRDDNLYLEAKHWKSQAEFFLLELYALRNAIDSVNQRYFDDHHALFPGSAADFERLVSLIETLVETYNQDVASQLAELDRLLGDSDQASQSPPLTIDLGDAGQKIGRTVEEHFSFSVDMAKAEALDQMGENEKAVAIMDRHV